MTRKVSLWPDKAPRSPFWLANKPGKADLKNNPKQNGYYGIMLCN